MKYIITNTAKSLYDLDIEWDNIVDITSTSLLIQNISANDIYINNKNTNVLTEWVVLKAWNESVYTVRDLKKIFLQAASNSEIRILF